MNSRHQQIGFSQRVRLEWLTQTANLVLAGNNKAAVTESLQELLHDKVSVGGQAVRGNREKVITLLLKTWVEVPKGLKDLRNDGLDLLKTLPGNSHLAVHWGMTMAVYPFWAAVAASTGRLLRLQGTAAAAQIQRRVREQYGERETVSRAARRVIRSFLDWQVMVETPRKGIYAQGTKLSIDIPELSAWLVEAALHARPTNSAIMNELLDGTTLFPFHHMQLSAAQLASRSPRLELMRSGLSDDLVTLKSR